MAIPGGCSSAGLRNLLSAASKCNLTRRGAGTPTVSMIHTNRSGGRTCTFQPLRFRTQVKAWAQGADRLSFELEPDQRALMSNADAKQSDISDFASGCSGGL